MRILFVATLLVFAPLAANAQGINFNSLNFNTAGINSMRNSFQDVLNEARMKGFDVEQQWNEIQKVLDYLFDNHADLPVGQMQGTVKTCLSLVMSKVHAKTAVVSSDEIISCMEPMLGPVNAGMAVPHK